MREGGEDRERIQGMVLPHDRRWIIHTPEFSASIFDYNWELTGFHPKLRELDAEAFVYGGNAYYIVYTLCPRMGWRVEEQGEPAGREIEITPEMIAAGIAAYGLWDRGDRAEWIVEHVYREMEAARLRARQDSNGR